MPETPSKTSNHQRIKEMMLHLSPEKAEIPYNLCFGEVYLKINFFNFKKFKKMIQTICGCLVKVVYLNLIFQQNLYFSR